MIPQDPEFYQTEADKKIFLIIDGHALIYRAFHAFPKTLISKEGILTNAVYGFSRILLRSIKNFEPEYLAVAFDHKEKTFRHDKFEDYKAHRPKMPEELRPQIQIIKDIVTAMGIPTFELKGFEADDLIGTLSVSPKTKDVKNLIVTGDKDMFQLVSEGTRVFFPKRGKFGKDKEYAPSDVLEKMGVDVDHIIDLKAIMGDSSDNIPGVRGIGPKGAVKLLTEFKDLDGVYKAVDQETQQRGTHLVLKGATFTKLVENKDLAFLSKDLATIHKEVPLEFDLEACRVKHYDKQAVVEIFTDLDFKTLVRFLPEDEFEGNVQEALF
jgi:DNA polymerase I